MRDPLASFSPVWLRVARRYGSVQDFAALGVRGHRGSVAPTVPGTLADMHASSAVVVVVVVVVVVDAIADAWASAMADDANAGDARRRRLSVNDCLNCWLAVVSSLSSVCR